MKSHLDVYLSLAEKAEEDERERERERDDDKSLDGAFSGASTQPDIFSLKHESSIFRSVIQPYMWFLHDGTG